MNLRNREIIQYIVSSLPLLNFTVDSPRVMMARYCLSEPRTSYLCFRVLPFPHCRDWHHLRVVSFQCDASLEVRVHPSHSEVDILLLLTEVFLERGAREKIYDIHTRRFSLNKKKWSTFSINILLKHTRFNSAHVLPQLRWKDIKFVILMPSSWETEALLKYY